MLTDVGRDILAAATGSKAPARERITLDDGTPGPLALTVGDLRRKIDGLPDDLPVMVEVFFEDHSGDEHHISGFADAIVEARCDDQECLYIRGDDQP
jgi:hypothetical protein